MIKKIMTLVVTSSLISAGLLYLGITLMGQFSPAHASSQTALVAGTKVQNSTNPVLGSNLSTKDLNNSTDKIEVSSVSPSISGSTDTSSQTEANSDVLSSGITPITGVTIADLLKRPEQYDDLDITITGIATSLNDEKFLLNDGTGKILIEVEDELVSLAIINGISVTVMGELDDLSDSSILEIDACTLSYQNETIIIDDCMDDDDDMDDEDDIDDSDDMDDDSDDMDDDSDDMDDDSGDLDDASDDLGNDDD